MPLKTNSLIIQFLIVASMGCENRVSVPEYELPATISSERIPTSVDQAIQILDHSLSLEAKQMLVSCDLEPDTESCRNFNIQFRLRLERQISNEWFRPANSSLYAQFSKQGLSNPEEMVAEILNLYIRGQEAGVEPHF